MVAFATLARVRGAGLDGTLPQFLPHYDLALLPTPVRLYSGSSKSFIDDTTRNRISEILSSEFAKVYHRPPAPEERRAWTNSLVKVKDVLREGRLLDNGVLLEYQLPLSSCRLDCMITGTDSAVSPRAEIVELKQWDQCESVEEPNEVLTQVGHGRRMVPHPSVQVAGYHQWMLDMHSAFYGDDPIRLGSCAYLHNFERANAGPLLEAKFQQTLSDHPVFLAEDFDDLVDRLKERLGKGAGLSVLKRVERGPLRPSRKLMEHVSGMIRNKEAYQLLDDQLVAFDAISTAAKSVTGKAQKRAIIVKGGPGTGKSVVALNLMASLLDANLNARYATGSRAFTQSLRKAIGPRGAVQFDWTNSYSRAAPDSVDVIIVDEAHRIRLTSQSRFAPATARSGIPQVQEILKAARVSAFFIDDLQGVRPGEAGTAAYIRSNATELNIPVAEFELEIQFRCKGSDTFVTWVESLLGLNDRSPRTYAQSVDFDFRVVESPQKLEELIRQRSQESKTARIVAGFCWEWSDPNPDGTLKPDVSIGDFARPWNARSDSGRLAPGIPKETLWATDPRGVDQIGCIYTAQGFEFDYVGVIIGPDLRVDSRTGQLVGVRENSKDSSTRRAGERASELIRRAYRVLLSRGIEGCYVYFTDPETRRVFENRLEASEGRLAD